VRRVAGYLKRPATILAACCGGLILIGLVWAAVTGADVRHSVVDALFVGGALIVVIAVGAGGGARRLRRGTQDAAPSDTPFGTVLLGALVILVGIALLKA
jgi:hypothetical protein